MTVRDVVIKSSIAASVDNASAEWKANYLMLAEILLQQQQYVCGDDFKAFCILRGLPEPDTHNRWVGMPTVLESKGWIERMRYVEPHRPHNHMPRVSLYRSTLFDETKQWTVS